MDKWEGSTLDVTTHRVISFVVFHIYAREKRLVRIFEPIFPSLRRYFEKIRIPILRSRVS